MLTRYDIGHLPIVFHSLQVEKSNNIARHEFWHVARLAGQSAEAGITYHHQRTPPTDSGDKRAANFGNGWSLHETATICHVNNSWRQAVPSDIINFYAPIDFVSESE